MERRQTLFGYDEDQNRTTTAQGHTMKTYCYLRVSDTQQTHDGQSWVLATYCKLYKIKPTFIKGRVSEKTTKHRPLFTRLLHDLRQSITFVIGILCRIAACERQ